MLENRYLFRGKRVDNNEWVYGCLVSYKKTFGIIEKENTEYTCDGSALEFLYTEVNPETISQFTGLTDKNGVKIFEGDLVRYKNGTSTPINIVHEGKNLTAYESNYSESYVIFYNGCFSLHNEPTAENNENNSQYNRTSYSGSINKYHGFEYEIIGNIHDDAKL